MRRLANNSARLQWKIYTSNVTWSYFNTKLTSLALSQTTQLTFLTNTFEINNIINGHQVQNRKHWLFHKSLLLLGLFSSFLKILLHIENMYLGNHILLYYILNTDNNRDYVSIALRGDVMLSVVATLVPCRSVWTPAAARRSCGSWPSWGRVALHWQGRAVCLDLERKALALCSGLFLQLLCKEK